MSGYHRGYHPVWRCDICGRRRKYDDINVMTYQLKDFKNASVNIKYCSDDSLCLEGAEAKAKTKEL